VEELEELGAEHGFAESLITLRFLDQLLEILRVARETESDPADAARAFYKVSETFQVPWIRRTIFETAGDDRWEQRAAQALSADLTRAHHGLATTVMEERKDTDDVGTASDRVFQERRGELSRFQNLLEEIRGEERISLSGLAVAVREITSLSEKLNGRRA
ncbi:MAG TPA: hypothetical protein VLL48_08135, partial [Longimicrobiales bacterium]|nr:hypothetical protein [Longimicrobiales bacterium]